MIPTLFLDLLCLFLHYFAPSVYFLVVLRFIMGFFHAGVALNSYVLVIELVGPNYRVLAANISGLTWALGSILMTLKAYYIRSWRLLTVALSAPYVVCFIVALWVYFFLYSYETTTCSKSTIEKLERYVNFEHVLQLFLVFLLLPLSMFLLLVANAFSVLLFVEVSFKLGFLLRFVFLQGHLFLKHDRNKVKLRINRNEGKQWL